MEHCGQSMRCLSEIQSYAAFHMSPEERVRWCSLGCHVIKGTKHRKWLPALNEAEVADSKQQKSSYTPRRPPDFEEEILEVIQELAKPCRSANPEVVRLLESMGVQDSIDSVLFIGSPAYRNRVYSHLRALWPTDAPRRYLMEFMRYLYNIVAYRAEDVSRELEQLWTEMGLDADKASIRSMIDVNLSRTRDKAFSLFGFVSKRNLAIIDPDQ